MAGRDGFGRSAGERGKKATGRRKGGGERRTRLALVTGECQLHRLARDTSACSPSAGWGYDSSIFSDMSVSTSSSRRLYSSMMAFRVEKKSCCWLVDISMMFCVIKSSIASIETLS